MIWRIGRKVPINVYEDNRPVCQCQTTADARLIVRAVNRLLNQEQDQDQQHPDDPATTKPKEE